MKERTPVQTSMLGIAKKAKSDKRYRFRNLYRELNEELLLDSWRLLRKNATVGAKVPGLLDDAEPKATIESGERIGQAFEREAAGNLSSRARAQSGTVNRWRPDTITTWLDELLPAGRGERG